MPSPLLPATHDDSPPSRMVYAMLKRRYCVGSGAHEVKADFRACDKCEKRFCPNCITQVGKPGNLAGKYCYLCPCRA